MVEFYRLLFFSSVGAIPPILLAEQAGQDWDRRRGGTSPEASQL